MMSDLFCSQSLQSLYRYGYSLTQNEANAYDLLQDALARYLARPHKSKTLDKPEFYIRRMMRNQFIDQLRHIKRFPLESLDQVDEQAADLDLNQFEQMMIDQHLLEQIWIRINPLERELLHLWAVEGMTALEISDQLETPRGTILSRIHRLRKKIEDLLSAMNQDSKGGHFQ